MIALIYLFIFILGAIVGSFLNVVILRLHEEKSFVTGRSHCPQCNHVLGSLELIPIFSFLFQKGKCRHCSKKISWQYPLVELVTAVLFILALTVNFPFGQTDWHDYLSLIRDLVFIGFLVVIFVYDLKWYLILDKVTIPAIITALIFNLILGFSWQSLLLALVVGFGFFGLQFALSKGKWIGGGDLRLGALMGLMLSWPGVILGLFLSYILGSIVGVGLLLKKKKSLDSKIPFGTFLAIGTIITLFWGDKIVNWYLSFLGF